MIKRLSYIIVVLAALFSCSNNESELSRELDILMLSASDSSNIHEMDLSGASLQSTSGTVVSLFPNPFVEYVGVHVSGAVEAEITF